MADVQLNLDSIQQTFFMVCLLIHDFLHDFDLKNTSNVSRLKKSQKLFSNVISSLPIIGGGMKGGVGIDVFLQWISSEGIGYYDEEIANYAGITLEIFKQTNMMPIFEAGTTFLDKELLTYIDLLLGKRWPRSSGDIIKEIRLVFNLVNDIILYTVGFLNTSTGNFFIDALGSQLYLPEIIHVGSSRDLQRGGISPTIVSRRGSLSTSSPKSSPKSSSNYSLNKLWGKNKSPSENQKSNQTKKLTQQQKYDNYVSSFTFAIDIFKSKASKEIEDEDNKKAYETFLTNFNDVFKLVTQKYNTDDPFEILNSLYFKKILVVFLMVGENADKSEILKGCLINSLYSEKEKKIDVGELIEKYKLNIKKSKSKKPKPGGGGSNVSNLVNSLKNSKKGGTREEDLEIQNTHNWEIFFTIYESYTILINNLNSQIKTSITNLEQLYEKDGTVDVFIPENISNIEQTINKVLSTIQDTIQEWTKYWNMPGEDNPVIKVNKTLDILQEINGILTEEYEIFKGLLAQKIEFVGTSRRLSDRGAINFFQKLQESISTIIEVLYKFSSEYIPQLAQLKDTYLTQIEINTTMNNKELQKIRSADLSPEEILLGNKINRCYAVGMFRYLGLLDINYGNDNSPLFFTDRMNEIINLMKQHPDNKYCKLLSLEFFILFRNQYTINHLWNDFNNMTHKKFDWSTVPLGSGLDTQLIEGVKIILTDNSINYDLAGVDTSKGIKNIINNSYTGLEAFRVTQENNVLCPYASIVDAMPQCSYNSATKVGNIALVQKNMNFIIADSAHGAYYTYKGIINGINDNTVTYTIQLTSSGNQTLTLEMPNINLETSTILQANSVYARLLQFILQNINEYFSDDIVKSFGENTKEFSNYVKKFWYNLVLNDEIFQGLANIGMRKGAGDFFQEVFATFQNNGGPGPNIVPDGPIYGLMGDRPSGVRCIFFNLLGRDGNDAINQNNISGYGTQTYDVIISAAPQEGGFKKIHRNKRKNNKKTRKNKRKINKKTRKNKRKYS